MGWVVKATQRPLLPCEGTMVRTAWAAGLAQAQSGRKGRREISSPTEVRTSDHRIIQHAASRCTEYTQNRVFLTPDVKSVNL